MGHAWHLAFFTRAGKVFGRGLSTAVELAHIQVIANRNRAFVLVEDVLELRFQRDFGQIAICDVRLPEGESGLDLALRLRALGKQVLLLSGETDTALRTRAAATGLPLLIKPVSGPRLRAALTATQTPFAIH